MDRNLAYSLLALLWFSASLVFFTYSWWTRKPSTQKTAIVYCAIFWLAGLATLGVWLVTSD